MTEPTGHYLNRTPEECVEAEQTSICQGCAALGYPTWPSRGWGAWNGDGRRDAVTEWRDELGYDPITGEEVP